VKKLVTQVAALTRRVARHRQTEQRRRRSQLRKPIPATSWIRRALG